MRGRTCLCFAFFSQITYSRPLRRTIAQCAHIRLTDERTFIPRSADGTACAAAGGGCAGAALAMVPGTMRAIAAVGAARRTSWGTLRRSIVVVVV